MTKEEKDTTTGETTIKDQEILVIFPTIKTPNNNTTDTTTNNTSQTQINPKDKTPTTKDKTTKCKINSIKTTAMEITTIHTQGETIIMVVIDTKGVIFVFSLLCFFCFGKHTDK